MSLIRISDKAMFKIMIQDLFDTSSGYNNNFAKVRIFKGAKPTYSDITNNSASSLRASDRLITFTLGAFNYATYNVPVFENSAQYNATAEASGTAAWALFSSYDGVGTQYPNFAVDVSEPGNGGDLIVSSVNITSGLVYSVSQIRFTLPSEYTA